MSYDLEERALALLRTDAELAVPLSRLHRALVAEAGPAIGGYGQLQDRLRRRPDLFRLIEPRFAPWNAEVWPSDARLEYQAALREAGIEDEPRVAAAEPGTAGADAAGVGPLLRRLDSSLLDLLTALEPDPDASAQVTEALLQVRELRSAMRCGPA